MVVLGHMVLAAAAEEPAVPAAVARLAAMVSNGMPCTALVAEVAVPEDILQFPLRRLAQVDCMEQAGQEVVRPQTVAVLAAAVLRA